ncbi:hypothetical protein CSUB01_04148 [Colletotrichum sublineola]|uniref:Uncharacterized protein n=1 Tax=Colletotrichum sublineola TaxID=1173701 RepID=A0A066XFA6_COLSU|nr:hypothetical protein CSUB01_04148 [Colletotrichum sublineola]
MKPRFLVRTASSCFAVGDGSNILASDGSREGTGRRRACSAKGRTYTTWTSGDWERDYSYALRCDATFRPLSVLLGPIREFKESAGNSLSQKNPNSDAINGRVPSARSPRLRFGGAPTSIALRFDSITATVPGNEEEIISLGRGPFQDVGRHRRLSSRWPGAAGDWCSLWAAIGRSWGRALNQSGARVRIDQIFRSPEL